VREIVALLARGGPVMIPLARPTDFEEPGTATE
jgi:hypothetical protein